MTETRELETASAIDWIFGPLVQPQTWLNVLYLLVSFPLGVVYFVVLTTLFSAGLGLSVVFIGLFLLIAAFAAANVMADLDRVVLNTLADAAIPSRPAMDKPAGNVLKRFEALVRSGRTWKRVGYLFVRFLTGIVSFTLVVALLPAGLALLTAPLTYELVPLMIGTGRVSTFDEAIFLCCFGAIFTLVTVHVLNWWTRVCVVFAARMLA